ncbi:MAG: hypothetical protein IJ379_02385 [Lachnospiraceae bacterium]|nr:hypothetical protein [Lachnospiraceae bacterium]
MDYQSTFLWEKGAAQEYNRVSLILQQAVIRRQSVLLACVCESEQDGKDGVLESGYFTEALVEWFHRELTGLLQRKATEREVEKSLEREVDRLLKEICQYAAKREKREGLICRGLLLWENRFWLFSKGDAQAYLINRRFNQRNLHNIVSNAGMEQISWEAGNVQKRLGILLCTHNFLKHVDKKQAAEVLAPEGEISEERLQKRLQELWQEEVHKGKEASVGAVYIRT